MQSVKSTLAIAAFIFSAGAFAEPTSALPFPAMPDTTAGAQPVHSHAGADTSVVSPPTQGQDNTLSDEKTTQVFLKEVVESDYEYQLQARQLKQQVELEKMRSEIRKLRGEDKKPVAAVSQAAPAQPAPSQQEAPTAPESKIPKELPLVLLESEIAGSARVAVTNSARSKLMYVRPGDLFEMDGVQYQLVRDKKSGLQVKGVTQ
ncbi:hypothetical protein OFY05_19980 [Pseudocitrobacter faecalis]|nr:hypothetical protein OFY05_19980 [Pseudocitrobacter faecalis]